MLVRTARAARCALRGVGAAAPRRCCSAPAAEQISAWQQAHVTPCAAFAATDMACMLLSADFIDAKFASAMGISALHAAAWGNAWGLGWGALAMGMVPRPTTTMTTAQMQGSAAKNAQMTGALFGLIVGGLIGMVPLVWQYLGLVRLWTPGEAALYNYQMQSAGVDAGAFAQRLLDGLKNKAPGTNFENLDPKAFADLVKKASPSDAAKADAIFKALDVGGKGFLDYDDFFRAMVSGQAEKLKKVQWTAEAYAIHQSMVDKDHQRLFDLINDVIRAMKTSSVGGVEAALRGLRGYTVYHFDREIELLGKCSTYPADELATHKQKHAQFVAALTTFEKKFQSQDVAAVCELCSGEVLTFLVSWLSEHIQKTDTRCTPHYKGAGFGSTEYQ